MGVAYIATSRKRSTPLKGINVVSTMTTAGTSSSFITSTKLIYLRFLAMLEKYSVPPRPKIASGEAMEANFPMGVSRAFGTGMCRNRNRSPTMVPRISGFTSTFRAMSLTLGFAFFSSKQANRIAAETLYNGTIRATRMLPRAEPSLPKMLSDSGTAKSSTLLR